VASAKDNTIAATPIAMTALSRSPRATAAVKRMGRACAWDAANSYGSGESVKQRLILAQYPA
jgi:hypothetical protein